MLAKILIRFIFSFITASFLVGCVYKNTHRTQQTSYLGPAATSSFHLFSNRDSNSKINSTYEEQGIASWYGSRFHRRRTSSGERYNMYQYTAAHKTLPLSSYLLVTNLSNHRQVVVKVNDRGPFASNRLIDLSYAAAKKLGMLGSGTARVKIKLIDRKIATQPSSKKVIAKHKGKHRHALKRRGRRKK